MPVSKMAAIGWSLMAHTNPRQVGHLGGPKMAHLKWIGLTKYWPDNTNYDWTEWFQVFMEYRQRKSKKSYHISLDMVYKTMDTAKLLCCTVKIRVSSTSRSPCAAQEMFLWPGLYSTKRSKTHNLSALLNWPRTDLIMHTIDDCLEHKC